jgi:hypothetical protein
VVGPAGTHVAPPRRARRPLPRRAIGVAFGAVLAVAALLTAAALANRSSDQTASSPDSTTAACVDLPYRPCEQPPAPGTDGERCLSGFHDIDGDPTTGCEIESDRLNGTVFDGAIVANLVPEDAVDRYPFEVDHESNLVSVITNLFCDNTLRVTLSAPAGVSMRLDVLTSADEVLGTAISADGMSSTVELGQPGCDPATLDLVARVSWFGSDRSGGNYTLTRTGSW